MQLRFILACSALLSLPAVFFARTGPAAVRVMSYNIRYDNPADSLDNWKYRKDFIVSMVGYHAPEVIGIQEGLAHQVAELAERMADYSWSGKGRDDGERAGEYAAIFFRSDRFELLNGSTFWLSPTPDVPSRGWDAALNRIVTWVELNDTRTGRPLLVFNTHFDHEGQVARRQSAQVLLREIRRLADGKSVLLTGDFNSAADEPPFQLLTADDGGRVRLQDALHLSASGHHGPLNTFSGFDARAGIIGDRIDYVFVSSGVTVLRHATVSDFMDNGRFPSDHLPVIADVLLP